MQQGAILQAARRDTKGLFTGAFIVFGFCAIVLGYNWTYVYNWILGPFTFDATLASPNGPQEFIAVDFSDLKATTIIEESTVGLFRGALESTSISANYFVADMGGEIDLVVKLDPDFSGDTVEGRLVPLPNLLRTKLEENRSSEQSFHPAVLDAEQVSYRWDFNLFVLAAALLSPVAVLLLILALWQGINVGHHPELSKLARRGTIRSVVASIESELSALGDRARAGALWISDNWIVTLTPRLNIFATDELVAAGVRSSRTKKGEIQTKLQFWHKDSYLSTNLETSITQAVEALARLKAQFPWLVVDDAKDFEKRWRDDKEACVTESERRRQAHA